MMQQINLYKDILKQEQKTLSLVRYAILLTLVCLGVAAYSIYAFWAVNTLEASVSKQREQLKTVQSQLDELRLKMPSTEVNATLTEDIGHWQNSENELTQMLQLIGDPNNNKAAGFSQYWQALARQSIPSVWLSKIKIYGLQQAIDLEGSTFKPGDIPLFLQKLQQEPVFAGKTFAKLAMQPSEKIAGQIDFKLNARMETAANKDSTVPKENANSPAMPNITDMLKENLRGK